MVTASQRLAGVKQRRGTQRTSGVKRITARRASKVQRKIEQGRIDAQNKKIADTKQIVETKEQELKNWVKNKIKFQKDFISQTGYLDRKTYQILEAQNDFKRSNIGADPAIIKSATKNFRKELDAVNAKRQIWLKKRKAIDSRGKKIKQDIKTNINKYYTLTGGDKAEAQKIYSELEKDVNKSISSGTARERQMLDLVSRDFRQDIAEARRRKRGTPPKGLTKELTLKVDGKPMSEKDYWFMTGKDPRQVKSRTYRDGKLVDITYKKQKLPEPQPVEDDTKVRYSYRGIPISEGVYKKFFSPEAQAKFETTAVWGAPSKTGVILQQRPEWADIVKKFTGVDLYTEYQKGLEFVSDAFTPKIEFKEERTGKTPEWITESKVFSRIPLFSQYRSGDITAVKDAVVAGGTTAVPMLVSFGTDIYAGISRTGKIAKEDPFLAGAFAVSGLKNYAGETVRSFKEYPLQTTSLLGSQALILGGASRGLREVTPFEIINIRAKASEIGRLTAQELELYKIKPKLRDLKQRASLLGITEEQAMLKNLDFDLRTTGTKQLPKKIDLLKQVDQPKTTSLEGFTGTGLGASDLKIRLRTKGKGYEKIDLVGTSEEFLLSIGDAIKGLDKSGKIKLVDELRTGKDVLPSDTSVYRVTTKLDAEGFTPIIEARPKVSKQFGLDLTFEKGLETRWKAKGDSFVSEPLIQFQKRLWAESITPEGLKYYNWRSKTAGQRMIGGRLSYKTMRELGGVGIVSKGRTPIGLMDIRTGKVIGVISDGWLVYPKKYSYVGRGFSRPYDIKTRTVKYDTGDVFELEKTGFDKAFAEGEFTLGRMKFVTETGKTVSESKIPRLTTKGDKLHSIDLSKSITGRKDLFLRQSTIKITDSGKILDLTKKPIKTKAPKFEKLEFDFDVSRTSAYFRDLKTGVREAPAFKPSKSVETTPQLSAGDIIQLGDAKEAGRKIALLESGEHYLSYPPVGEAPVITAQLTPATKQVSIYKTDVSQFGKTDVGLKPKIIFKQEIKNRDAQIQDTKLDSITKLKLERSTKLTPKTDMFRKVSLDTGQRLAQVQKSKLKQIQLQKSKQAIAQIIPTQIITPTVTKITKTPPLTQSKLLPVPIPIGGKKRKSVAKAERAYSVQVKRFGMFTTVKTGLTKAEAIVFGKRETKRTLGATFKIKPTENVISRESKYTLEEAKSFYGPEFRTYEIKGGKKKELKDTFIQIKQARLGTKGETVELQKSRLSFKSPFGKSSKKKKGGVKWF